MEPERTRPARRAVTFGAAASRTCGPAVDQKRANQRGWRDWGRRRARGEARIVEGRWERERRRKSQGERRWERWSFRVGVGILVGLGVEKVSERVGCFEKDRVGK